MNNKKLTICLDFDGVIANAGELKRAIAAELTGKSVTLAEASGERVRVGGSVLTASEWEMIKEKVYGDSDLMERLLPVQDSIATIKEWLLSGHTVTVVTARTEQKRDNAERWLHKHGISIPVIGAGARTTKVPHLAGCDIFVDDDADRAREASTVCTAYFFKWPYNDEQEGIINITSLKDIAVNPT